MEPFFALLGVALIPILVVFFLPRERSFFEKGWVKGFGLGIYLMLVVVLLFESVEHEGAFMGLLWLVLGILISLAIGVYFKEFHHHHTEEESVHSHNLASTGRILVSDFFHNIVDGVAILAGFAISPVVGGLAFLGVLGHQILQQIGQHILLVEGGVRVAKAIIISLLVALSIFFGYFLNEGPLESILLAMSAGIVAWKVWVDLIHTSWDKKTITGFVSGALILAVILLAIPHSHGHEEGEHGHDETEEHEAHEEDHGHEEGDNHKEETHEISE